MWAHLFALSLLCAAVATAGHNREKREEQEGGELFWLGGRYGRSLHNHVTSRSNRMRRLEGDSDDATTNRFYMGSRYGKRAAAPLSDLERWKREICDCPPHDAHKREAIKNSA